MQRVGIHFWWSLLWSLLIDRCDCGRSWDISPPLMHRDKKQDQKMMNLILMNGSVSIDVSALGEHHKLQGRWVCAVMVMVTIHWEGCHQQGLGWAGVVFA